MFDVTKISKNLIAVSLVSVVLVVWLGARYLSAAHNQFSGASQLHRSVVPESTLFNLLDSLGQERDTTQRIFLRAEQSNNEKQQLTKEKRRTKELFAQARQEINQAHGATFDNGQHRYSLESINMLLDEVDAMFDRIAVTRFVLSSQTSRNAEVRDETIRMQLFDVYVKFAETVNKLRRQTYNYPEKEFIDVLIANEKRDAIWTIIESINQANTLTASFLMKRRESGRGSLNVDNLALRLLQQHELTSNALTLLDETSKSNPTSIGEREALTTLTDHYNESFRLEIKRIILSAPLSIDPEEKLTEWNRIASITKQSVQKLQAEILADTVATAEGVKKSATKSLFLDAFLVLLCMLTAYATFKIGRNIQHQANHDELTGLPNRRFLKENVQSLFNQTDTSANEKLVLMTMDLNGFKSINDTMGHWAGDILLIKVAERLKSNLRKDMILARMGGDEFASAFITKDENFAYEVACKLRSTFDESFLVGEGFVNIDASFGYSIYPDDASTIQDLEISSDFAMFSAKQSGRKTIQPYDSSIASKYENRIVIEKDLRAAIENNQLELYYQPQVSCVDYRVNSVEALIRWNHPERGMVPPNDFIEIAEETGLMPAIGNWVLNESCRQAAEWAGTENRDIRIAVNVSVHQIAQTEFVQSVFDTIERHGISCEQIEIEVTESVVMTDINWIVKSLTALKEKGIKIALDDFGTGYSSLSQLQKLPLDTLKIDRSFIDKLDSSEENLKSITATIASIAQTFKLETVAEGIETENQLIEVSKLGIDIAQGYYYSKPVARHEVIDKIRAIEVRCSDNRNAA